MSTKKPKDIDIKDYVDNISMKSIENALAVGKILPRLQARLNTVYTATIISDKKELNSFVHKTFGKSYSLDINHDGMRKSIIVPKSFYFQLIIEMIRGKLTTKENVENNTVDFSVLKDHQLTFQKNKGSTKTMDNVDLYSVQLD